MTATAESVEGQVGILTDLIQEAGEMQITLRGAAGCTDLRYYADKLRRRAQTATSEARGTNISRLVEEAAVKAVIAREQASALDDMSTADESIMRLSSMESEEKRALLVREHWCNYCQEPHWHGECPRREAAGPPNRDYGELRSELLDAVDSCEEAIVALVDKANEISLAGHDPTRMGVTSEMRELEELVSIGVE